MAGHFLKKMEFIARNMVFVKVKQFDSANFDSLHKFLSANKQTQLNHLLSNKFVIAIKNQIVQI